MDFFCAKIILINRPKFDPVSLMLFHFFFTPVLWTKKLIKALSQTNFNSHLCTKCLCQSSTDTNWRKLFTATFTGQIIIMTKHNSQIVFVYHSKQCWHSLWWHYHKSIHTTWYVILWSGLQFEKNVHQQL